MIFNSDIFLFAFLPIVFTLFWLARTKQQRYLLLTISGYVFYGYWDWRYCGLLALSSLISFGSGILIDRSSTPRGRRFWMLLSVTFDLALLGFFKYYGFFATNIDAVIPGAVPVISVALPIGISFYTFHTISYIVDVAAGRVKATGNILEYLAYVSLFSQLVAGPIVRFKQIEGDLEEINKSLPDDYVARGVGLFSAGLVKKVIIADSVAALINPLLTDYSSLSMAAAWAAALGYTFQLYFDFSGYSDMAMGLGYLFRLHIPANFDTPYRATSITDFWRRWHISLSSWLRDYLYIPLGGNRKGDGRTYVNLLLTMLLGGLWHGANWTFVIWGAYHGLLLAAERLFQPALTRVPVLIRGTVTFLLVVAGWVMFRAESAPAAWTWLSRMAGIGRGDVAPPTALLVWCVLLLPLSTAVPEPWRWTFRTGWPAALRYAAVLILVYLFMNGRESPFLYYQF